MPLSVESAIKTEFLDNAHYDVVLDFSTTNIAAFGKLNDIVVTDADGLVPFDMKGGVLKTPTFTITCYVTAEQDALLRKLFEYTIHPSYVDLRYPILVTWGHGINNVAKDCYLSEYDSPERVNYSKAELLTVVLSLRPFRNHKEKK